MKTIGYVSAMALLLAGCGGGDETAPVTADDMMSPGETAEVTEPMAETMDATAALAAVIDHERRDERRARDEWRHPMETLSFFGASRR